MKLRICAYRVRQVLVSLCICILLFVDSAKVIAVSSSPFTQTDWSSINDYESKSNINTSVSGEISLSQNTGSWLNPAWGYRKKITFDNSSQNENLTNFVVMVKLDSTRIDYTNTQNTGQDIRFTDSDGTTKLSYEIEKWDEAGTSIIWVKVPQIDASSNTDYIYIYYGNTTAASESDASAVWTDTARFHMNETTTTDTNQFKGTGTYETGKFGQAIGVYGNADGSVPSILRFPNGGQVNGNNYSNYNPNQGTLSVWVKPSWNGNDNKEHFIYSTYYYGIQLQIAKTTGNNLFVYYAYTNGTIRGMQYSVSNWTANSWYHIVTRWDADNPVAGSNYGELWVDGLNVANYTSSWVPFNPGSSNFSVIGAKVHSNPAYTSAFNGLIDDFAIFDRPLTTTEIADLYNGGTGRTADYVADSSLKFYAKLDGTGTLNAVNYNTAGNVDQTAYNATTNTNGNMVVDGNMEAADVSAWSGYGTPTTMEKVTAGSLFDSRSMHVVTNNVVSYQGVGRVWKSGASVGENYHFETWVRVVSGAMRFAVGQGAFHKYLHDANGNYIINSPTWVKLSADFQVQTAGNQEFWITQDNATPSEFYVDNVSITPNLVNNGGMEGTKQGTGPYYPGNWSLYGSPASGEVDVVTSDKHSGSNSVYINTNLANKGVLQTFSGLTNGAYYKIGFWAKVSAGTGKLLIGGCFNNGGSNTAVSVTDSSWKYYSYINKYQSGTCESALYLASNSTNQNTLYFDDVSVIPLDNIATSMQSDTKVMDSVYGPELITNGGFETHSGTLDDGISDTFSAWTLLNVNDALGKKIESTSISNSGSSSIKLNTIAGTSNYVYFNQDVPIKPNTRYLVTYKTRGDGTNDAQIRINDVANNYNYYINQHTGNTQTTYQSSSYLITAPNNATYLRVFGYSPIDIVGTVWYDDVSVKEVLNPLSVHGDSDGVTSNTNSKIGNGYTFDGSSGYLRQKTYDTNAGTLSYGTNTLVDSLQNFDDWDNDDGGQAEYMLVATNSDNTTSWGYLCTNSSPTTTVTIYTKKDCTSGANGFNGTAITGKTPVGYEVRKTDFQITGSMAIGTWIKPSNIGNRMNIISKTTVGGSAFYLDLIETGFLRFNVNPDDAYRDSNIQLSAGDYYHVVLVYVPNSNLDIYVNGVLANGTLTGSIPALLKDSFFPLQMGYILNPRFFSGSLDEAFIKPSAMSAAQIAATYKSESDTFATYASEEQYFPSAGTLTSNIFDTELTGASSWGNLSYTAATPTGTSVQLKARSSNSSSMTGATDFSTCTAITSGSDISANSCVTDGHRYIQYQALLSSTNGVSTPQLTDVSIAFSSSDSNAPVITLDTVPSVVSSQNYDITGTAQDAASTVSSVEYQADSTSGSWQMCTANDGIFDEQSEVFTCGLSLLTEGSHTVYIRSSDINNNQTPLSSYLASTFMVDLSNPVTPGTPQTATPTNDTTPTWTFSASSDTGAGLANPAYTLEWSKSQSFSSGVESAKINVTIFTHVTPLTDGRWYMRIKAEDGVSKYSAYSPVGIVDINTGAPSGSIKINSGDDYVKKREVNLTLSASSGFFTNAADIQMKISNKSDLSDAAWESFAINKSWILTEGEGEKTVYVQYKDLSGNISGAYTDGIIFDISSPPAPELISPDHESYTSSKRPLFRFRASANTDNASGLSRYRLTIDNGESGNFTVEDIPSDRKSTYEDLKYEIRYENFDDDKNDNNYISVLTRDSILWGSEHNNGELKEGKRTWTVTSIDRAGNEQSSSRVIFADFKGPEVELAQINDVLVGGAKSNYYTTSRNPKFSGKVIDRKNGDLALAAGPSSLELTLYKKENNGSYRLISIANQDLSENHFAGNNEKVEDNARQDADKYSSFEYVQKNELNYGEYKISLQAKDKAGNIGPEIIINLKVGGFMEVAAPEEKKEIDNLVQEEINKKLTNKERLEIDETEKENIIKDITEDMQVTRAEEVKEKNPGLLKVGAQVIESGKNITYSLGGVLVRTSSLALNAGKVLVSSVWYGAQITISKTGQGVMYVREISQSEIQPFMTSNTVWHLGKIVNTIYSNNVTTLPGYVGSGVRALNKGFENVIKTAGLAGSTVTLSAKNASLSSVRKISSQTTDVSHKLNQLVASSVSKIGMTGDIWLNDDPTRITGLRVLEAGSDYVVIYWETNHLATSKVSYGDSYDYGKDVQSNEKVKIHKIKVSGLKPNTTYYYEVMSQSAKNYVYDARHEFDTAPVGK